MTDDRPPCSFCGAPSRQTGVFFANVVQEVHACRGRECRLSFARATDPEVAHQRDNRKSKRRRRRPRQSTHLTRSPK